MSGTSGDEPKGVSCECGEFTPFSMWVYAHWTTPAVFTCPKCDRKYTVQRGRAKPDGVRFSAPVCERRFPDRVE